VSAPKRSPATPAISSGWQAIVLVLTLCAVLLALCRLRPLELLQIGRPEMTIKGLE